MMTTQRYVHTGRRRRRRWQRAIFFSGMIVALVLSALLIYFRPGTDTPPSQAGAPAATAAPQYQPGTRWYYQGFPIEPQQ